MTKTVRKTTRKTTRKTAAAASTAIKVTEFMKAWGGAQGEGRATAFREDPTEENMQALLDAAAKNLRKLMKGGKIAKSRKTAKTEKVAKPTRAAKGKAKSAKIAKLEKAIVKIDRKIVRLSDRRDAAKTAAKRNEIRGDIRDLKGERKELKAKLKAAA